MLKCNKKGKAVFATICALGLNPLFSEIPTAHAVYESRSDTGTTIFDYIENRRRERRDKMLTEEQMKLLEDINETKERLPKPISENDPTPAAFEGDDLTYDVATGEFTARGNVDIIQLDGYRFQGEDASGNLNTNDVKVDGKVHVLQISENAPRVTLDGYNAVYNYNTKIGTMDNVKGKSGEYYISGKHFEFYPDHMVAYDATQTKCGAKKPDYHVSAKRMEVWPEQILRMYDATMWMGKVPVGSKKYMERKIESNEDTYFPRVGYDSKYGVYVEDNFDFAIRSHVIGQISPHINSKEGIRSHASMVYGNRDFRTQLLYGYYHDSNSKWLKKMPSWESEYRRHFDHLPGSYFFRNVYGKWEQYERSSIHQEYEAGVSRDPINFHKNWVLFLNTSYKITKDNVKSGGHENTKVNGFNYDFKLAKEFNDDFAAYVGYEYSKSTSQNSLFDFDMDSYSKKILMGASYRLTDKDRFVVGCKFNAETNKLEDADYYWFRDLHCSTAVLRWRQKRHEWAVQWQFTPW